MLWDSWKPLNGCLTYPRIPKRILNDPAGDFPPFPLRALFLFDPSSGRDPPPGILL